MSYRLAVLKELPRTGVPEAFASWGDYARAVAVLVDAGVIRDASELWWDIRPSVRFPTLEMRIADVCTAVDDTMTVAAVYVCLLSMLARLRRENVSWRRYRTMLVEENRWRAQRHGFDEGLIDFGKGAIVPYPDLFEEMVALVSGDARGHGCEADLLHGREILRRGTSAHRQRAIRAAALADGADETEALTRVVDWLIDETVAGIAAA
jgi:carboxylate-amine ligase